MGVSSITGIISLVGFLIFLGGIAIVVLAAQQNRSGRGGIGLIIIGLLIGIVFAVIGNGLLFVGVTEVAVITNTLTGDLEQPRNPGTSIIIPGLQVPTLYPTSRQSFVMDGNSGNAPPVDATTIDGQQVAMDIAVFYNIDASTINDFHRQWGGSQNNYTNFITSATRTVSRDVVATYRAENIYGLDRVQMQQDINDQLRVVLAEEGFILDVVNVRGLEFSDTFVEAIEAAAASQQRALQARQEAERNRTIAQGERDAAIARAEGEAQSIILRAQAEAEALRLVSEQIAANPLLVQYQYIQTLGPNVRLAIVPSNSPFLFDFESIAANPDFVAPEVPTGGLDLAPEPTPTPGS